MMFIYACCRKMGSRQVVLFLASNQSNAVGNRRSALANSPTFLFLETPNREPVRPVVCALVERSTAEVHVTGGRTTGRH